MRLISHTLQFQRRNTDLDFSLFLVTMVLVLISCPQVVFISTQCTGKRQTGLFLASSALVKQTDCCVLPILRSSYKQGSSENDGRSDVNNRLEFKIVSYCCYPKCCRTNCGHFVDLGNFPSI